MAGTPERLLPEDIYTLDNLQHRYLLKNGLNILFCAIFLGIFVISYNNVISYGQSVVRTSFVLKEAIPVPVQSIEPKQQTTDLVAIIVQGSSGGKEHMARLGIELARAGITSYLLDFPGYGESPIPFANDQFSQHVRQENATVLEEVVNYVQSHRRTAKHISILLVGYSSGSVTVSDYLEMHDTEHNVVLNVLLSPTDQHIFTTGVPANLLLITGKYDPFAPIANTLFQQKCLQGVTRKGSTIDCGSPVDSASLQEVVLPFLDNNMLPLSQSTSQAILVWIHRFYPKVRETTTTWLDPYLCWLFLATIGVYLALFPLGSLLVNVFTLHAIPRVFQRWNTLFLGLFLLVSMPISLIISLFLAPFRFIHLFLGDTIASYLFCVTLITTLLMLVTRRFLPIPPFRQIIRQLLIGFILALFLYFTFGQLVLLSWNSLTMTDTKLWRGGILFVILWPFFLFYEQITRTWWEHNILDKTIYASLVSYGLKALLLLSLFLLFSLIPGKELLGSLWPVILLLLLCLEGCCSQLYKRGRAAIAGATVSALVVAYAFTVLFPFTS